jgi:hypothetical protein
MKFRLLLLIVLIHGLLGGVLQAADADKEVAIANRLGIAADDAAAVANASPGGSRERLEIANGEARVPVIVVRGTPYQMGEARVPGTVFFDFKKIAPINPPRLSQTPATRRVQARCTSARLA